MSSEDERGPAPELPAGDAGPPPMTPEQAGSSSYPPGSPPYPPDPSPPPELMGFPDEETATNAAEPERGPRPYVRLMAAIGGVGAVALVVAAVMGATTEPAVPQTDMPPPASIVPTELLPSGVTEMPLPSGYPSDWLTGVPSEWPTSWPTGGPDYPTPTFSFPSLPELPTLTELPSDWPSLDLPQDGAAP